VNDPLEQLARWLGDAREAGVATPAAMTLATATADGRPSARVVSLKCLDAGTLVFTTALRTRKVEEMVSNPRVAATFHWSALGRQARIEGNAEIGERELAEELFAARPRSHRLQALVSPQGEEIDDLDELRARLSELSEQVADRPIPCPADWGAVRIRPKCIEFWTESADRLHDRLVYEAGQDGWRCARLAP
jgi:pyridoxamine 5'-phosphate oxidase